MPDYVFWTFGLVGAAFVLVALADIAVWWWRDKRAEREAREYKERRRATHGS